jgi:hypothetical protein
MKRHHLAGVSKSCKCELRLGGFPEKMINHLQHDLKMKYCHLSGVIKAERVHCAQIMLDEFDVHSQTITLYLVAEEESLIIYNQIPLRT